MRTDYSKRPAHPVKIKKCMEAFVNDACDLVFPVEYTCFKEGKSEEDWKRAIETADLTAIRSLYETEKDKMSATIKIIMGGCNGACTSDLEDAEDTADEDKILHILTNFKELQMMETWAVHKTVKEYCSMFKGFSAITLTLLHELGHLETNANVPKDYDRMKAINNIEAEIFSQQFKTKKESCYALERAYVYLIDEFLAWEWAKNWLNNPENRKRAKAFEKEFFKNFRK